MAIVSSVGANAAGRAGGLLYFSAGDMVWRADEKLSGLTVGVTKQGLHLQDPLLHLGQGRIAPHGVEGVVNAHFGLKMWGVGRLASTRYSQMTWHEASLGVGVQHCPDVVRSMGERVNGTNDKDPQNAQKWCKTYLFSI